MMYIPVPSATNGEGIKTNYKPTSKPEATPYVEEDEFMPCPTTPRKPEAKAQKCILPPSAPQVEKNVPKASSIKSAKLASAEKPRTRSTSRAERFMIPAPLEISDDEQDTIFTVVQKPYGLSASFHEYKPPEECTGDDERVFNEALRKAQSSRTYPPHLRVKGRKELGMLMSYIIKVEAAVESSGEIPLRHSVTRTPDTTSTGDYDDLPELLSEEGLGEM